MSKTIVISGCSQCPMIDMCDFCSGYLCMLKGSTHTEGKEHNDNWIKESKKYQPITPKWCPLKVEGEITFQFKKKENEK